MTTQTRIILVIVSLIIIIISKYGPVRLIEIIGQWFIYSIAAAFCYIAIRGK